MIHFDFIVEDVDAENIFDCINAEIDKINLDVMDQIANQNYGIAQSLRNHIEYLKGLKVKMINTRVKES